MTARTRAAAPLALVAALALAPGAAGAPKDGPGVTLPAGPLRVGQRVLVGLDGWPAGTVQVEVCGNAARRGLSGGLRWSASPWADTCCSPPAGGPVAACG
ncbi:hypothetical protein QLR68_22950 [Micromonospora sp. DH15]|nr:hypothetical protein [Micromonospora sp. DH15]